MRAFATATTSLVVLFLAACGGGRRADSPVVSMSGGRSERSRRGWQHAAGLRTREPFA